MELSALLNSFAALIEAVGYFVASILVPVAIVKSCKAIGAASASERGNRGA